MRLYWLLTALVLSVLLAGLHYVALEYFLYWRYVWLDTFVHFLGGATIAVFGIGLLERYRPLLFLGMMLLVAVGWEVFEFLINAEREANFAFDTALDLLMDACGVALVYIIARLSLWRSA